MAGDLLRNRDGGHARVGFVELFFDLVFVFAITQISHTLLEHLTWMGALQAAMMLGAIWWAWIDTSWITNWLDPERAPVRIMLFALMAAGLVLSTSLPGAFAEKGLIFAVAFAALQVGRGLFALWAVRRDAALKANFQRICVWAIGGAVLWIAGGLAEGQTRLLIWLIALLAEFAAPALYFWVPGLGRSTTADWQVEGGHIAERVGLFIIICLGETLLVTGATFAGLIWTVPVDLAFATAFLSTLAMWWIYFSASHDAASDQIAHAADPGRIARAGYTYGPILIVAGIVVTAVGDELLLAHPEGHVSPEAAAVLIGGPLLFMVGSLTAKYAVWGKWSPVRMAGVVGLAALSLIVPYVTPLALAASATGALIAVAGWETWMLHRQPPQQAR